MIAQNLIQAETAPKDNTNYQNKNVEEMMIQPIELENLQIYHFATVNMHNNQILTIDLQASMKYMAHVQVKIYKAYN